ncbi:MAG: hypothetical protein GY953_50055, partial [bacterium]|nr:hypothetical protein [bacterium]
SPFHEGSSLRGCYFSSGVQVGAPIDRVVSRIIERIQLEPEEEGGVPAGAVEGRSYFIDDMFLKVIFPDQGLARSSTAAVTRRRWLRRAGIAGCAAATVVGLYLSVGAYFGDSGRIAGARTAASGYDHRKLGWDQPAAFTDLRRSFEQLDGLAGTAADPGFFNQAKSGYTRVRADYIKALKRTYLAPIQDYLTGKMRGLP